MKNKIKISVLLLGVFMLMFSINIFAVAPETQVNTGLIDTTGRIDNTYGGIPGYNTHTFQANINIGGQNIIGAPAFCTNHKKHNVTASDRVEAKLYTTGVDGYDGRIAAILYYGFGGPGDVTGGGAYNDTYFATTYLLHYYMGEGLKNKFAWSYNPWLGILETHAEAQDAPADFAYILYTPLDNPDLQVIASSAGMMPKKGNLVVEKKDTYGIFRSGATFHVTGPGGTWDVTTGGDGKAYLNDIELGTYIITETQAPNGMLNEPENKTVNVTVNAGETATYTRTNGYPSGSIRLVKYDEDNRGATLGSATLKGAVFELRAAEQIKQGNTIKYEADDWVATVTTDESGNTEPINNLPVGNYYYIETKASEGFNINNNRIPVSINYAGQDTNVIAETYNEVPEAPIYGNIQITKRLQATDYDREINLAGAQFKATYIKDRSQVYYSNISGIDGICNINKIPYGEYEVEEIVTPSSALKIANFNVNISGNGQTYTYTKVDTSKKIKIEVIKEILLRAGEATDAHIDGAIFTVYRDSACRDKVCDIGPTDTNGYAISGTMRTGIYYMKETTFPIGIDPDAVIPGENVTYRNKVYTVGHSNTTQNEELRVVPITIQNEPNRNHIEIIKDLGKTSNTPQFPLDKCKFTATLISSIGTDHEFSRECTAETDRNGYCIIEDLPYGTYIVEETTVSPISLKCADFRVFVEKDKKVKVNPYVPKDGTFLATTLGETIGTTKEYSTSYEWLDASGHIVDVPKVMQIKIRKVDKDGYENGERVDYTQGDAVLKGAIYQIYRYDPQTDDYTEYVYDITVDHKDSEGYWCAESRDLLVGKYMVKEKIKSTETVDGVTYYYSYAEGYLSDPNTYYFEQRPDLQEVRLTYHKDVSKEEVIRGRVQVIKYDNVLDSSENVASEGAILRLTLDSSKGKIYYDVTIDKKGYGDFIDTNDEKHSTAVKSCYGYKYLPYTIPYGKYTITEVKESNKEEHTSFFVQPEDVEIRRNVQKEYRIEADEPVQMYIKIQKRDKDTGATVELSGAKFKVWNVEKQEFVSQMIYPSGEYIEEFETNDEGYVILPQKLEAGDYIIYETIAPKGYYLEEEFRIPENKEDIGKKGKGGKYVVINKAAMKVEEDTPYNKTDLFYIVDMPNEPLKVKLELEKKGEMLSEVLTETTEYGEKYTPKYKMQGLKDVTYEIYAAEDIKSPDERVTYVKAGEKVDTIKTREDGKAITKELYPGEYEIKETETPLGYLTDENIENVVLTNTDTLKKVQIHKKELTNVRQKLELTFEKTFDEVNYADGEEVEKKAVFGIYTNEAINNYQGKELIGKDKLVDIIEVEGDNADVTSTIDLPKGKYYVQELEASYPYKVSEEKQYFSLEYTNNTDEFVVKAGETFNNTYDSASITLIKLSSTTVDNIILNGDEIDTSELDEKVQEILSAIKGMTEEEIKEYFKENNVKFVAGATYRVYTDEKCEKELRIKNEETGKFEIAEFVTNDTGLIKIEGVPLGHYYVKEIESPKGYELSEEVVEIDLDLASKNTMMYQAITEPTIAGELITKIDIFTSEVVPNCMFEIADEEGNVMLRSVTDEEGNAYIPVVMFEDGKTYTYTEIKAPDIYDIDTTPHEFTAKINEEGEWVTDLIEVSNIRKTREVIVRKLDAESGEPLEGCVFTIALINPKTGDIVVNEKTGEPVYLVENAVTGENGEYVIEKAPMGTYKFMEIKAPEGYELDEDLTGYEFTIDNDSPETIIFEVTNTGDIQVIVLSIVAFISIIGCVFVLRKKFVCNN